MTSPGGLPAAFVLAKDERANLSRSLPLLVQAGFHVTVLDSGSTDGTQDLARAFEGVEVIPTTYNSHAESYNEILTSRAAPGSFVLVLDADMILNPNLCESIRRAVAEGEADAYEAPIRMWWGGRELRHGSLCPPKPILFRAGGPLFEPSGHGERLRPGVRLARLAGGIVHDDRKPFGQTLATQARYGADLAGRVAMGRCSSRDRARARWPIFVLLTPLWSFLVRGGFRGGRVGLLYAMDRLIAEAILFRQCLALGLASISREGAPPSETTPPGSNVSGPA